MTYVINTNTNEIKEFEQPFHLLSENYSSGDWREATEEEALPFKLEKLKKEKIAQCKAYLNKTDWQVVRFAETQVAVDSQVLTNRALARSRQDEINAISVDGEYFDENQEPITALQALENININF